MSAFDDEFGLFGDDVPGTEEDERRSTLGARIIASGSEIVIDEIEPEDDDRGAGRGRPGPGGQRGRSFVPRKRERDERRPALDPEVARDRATALLEFLAKGLVSKPETIAVFARDDQRQGLVLELEVAAEDLGKVIGRAGRVAQALRTVVRAGVEGRVAIEIIDVQADGQAGADVAMMVEASAEEEADAVSDQREAAQNQRGHRDVTDANDADGESFEPESGDDFEAGATRTDNRQDEDDAAFGGDSTTPPVAKPRGRVKAQSDAAAPKKPRGRAPRASANVAPVEEPSAPAQLESADSTDQVAPSSDEAVVRPRTRRKRSSDDVAE